MNAENGPLRRLWLYHYMRKKKPGARAPGRKDNLRTAKREKNQGNYTVLSLEREMVGGLLSAQFRILNRRKFAQRTLLVSDDLTANEA